MSMEGVTQAELGEIRMDDTRIVEYRIIMPLTLEQYAMGKTYMVNKLTREEKGEVGEGVEIMYSERYPGPNGENFQKTYKIYHFKSRVPAAVRWAIPDKYLHFHEQSINEWPHTVTTNTIPGMGKDFRLICESVHIPYARGEQVPDNPANLPEEQLKKREIVYIDIIGKEVKPNPKEVDLRAFTCPELGINEPIKQDVKKCSPKALPKWVETYEGPMMCVVKICKFHFKWFGLQGLANKIVFKNFYPDLFTNTHRKLMVWAKEWATMTFEQILEYERETEEMQGHDFVRDESDDEHEKENAGK